MQPKPVAAAAAAGTGLMGEGEDQQGRTDVDVFVPRLHPLPLLLSPLFLHSFLLAASSFFSPVASPPSRAVILLLPPSSFLFTLKSIDQAPQRTCRVGDGPSTYQSGQTYTQRTHFYTAYFTWRNIRDVIISFAFPSFFPGMHKFSHPHRIAFYGDVFGPARGAVARVAASSSSSSTDPTTKATSRRRTRRSC